ncbi:hypothetical protein [Flavobacterium suzhouense]|uniref:Uncharacterized protein n=1 Tax=Flavobacterium suzhouense TaxID=1529638 RepID=A0ABW5NTB3_9FLAO
MKNIYYIALIFSLFIGFSFYINWNSRIENVHKNMLEDIRDENYIGIIVKKYTKVEGKYPVHVLLLNNKQQVEPGRRFWEKTAVGDSVVKIKGTDYSTVYKKDGTKDSFDYGKWIEEISKEE